MSVVRSFTLGQWEALGRRLDALPEKAKDGQHLKVGDGVKSIRTQISTSREKGYTLNELIEQAAQEGIDVNLNSLRYAMRRAEEKGRIRRESKEAARGQVARSARSARAKTSAQTNTARDNLRHARSQQKGDGGVTSRDSHRYRASSDFHDFVNFCDAHRDSTVIVNTAARSQAGVAQYGETLSSTLDELARRLVVLWVINRQRDSLELLLKFGATFPNAVTHVVRNGYFGPPEKFSLYRESNLRKAVEAQGQSLDFPDLADRVADELRSQRLSIRKATEMMHIGERVELLRWRALYSTMFARVTANA
jgi:hypothetical protein